MSKRSSVAVCGFVLALWLLPSLLVAVDDRPLLERMFDDEMYGGFTLSPDGRYIAYYKRESLERSRLETWELATGAQHSLLASTGMQIHDYEWADNDTLVVKEFDESDAKFYIVTYDARLKRNSGGYNLPASLLSKHTVTSNEINPWIMSGLPAVPGKVALGVPTESFWIDPRRRRSQQGGGRDDVVLFDYERKRSETVAENPGYVDDWILDQFGNVRYAISTFGGGPRVQYRDSNEEEFREVDFPPRTLPIGFLPGSDKALAVTLDDRDTSGIVVIDPATGEFLTGVIGREGYDLVEFSSGNFDPPRVRLDPNTGMIVGIVYDGEKPETIWLDRGIRQLQAAVDNLSRGQTNYVRGLAADNETVIFYATGDVNPGTLIAWNFKTDEKVLLFERMPSVSPEEFSPIQPIEFEARDGATIHGYISTPKDKEGPFPFITIVHGGPMARDTWGFDAETQYFVSLGFAVMKVNFRGSTGYGLEYRHDDDWRSVLRYGVEDVVDGTLWAIEAGIADPDLCVVAGASFGGYASMMIPAHAPDLYQAAMPAMGVYDWELMIEYDRKTYHPRAWESLKSSYQQLIDDPESFVPFTPVKNVDKVKIPLLVLHGHGDQRVDIEQYDALIDALKRADAEFETYFYTRGGHGFYATESWVAYYSRQGEFLRKHIDF
jgi:dipeptidyl aminopeptidase/acylaminoacyl peptidase